MNKQEALAYIESGAEAVKATHQSVHISGERVRLLGYGYRKNRRYEPRPTTVEQTAHLRSDSAHGVLIERLGMVQEWNRYEVVQLRQLYATTVAEERIKRAEADAEEEQRRTQQHEQLIADTARARELVELLGAGAVIENYHTAFIKLTLIEAEVLAARPLALTP